MQYSPYAFVKALSFVRYGGTPEEAQAAALIQKEIAEMGGESTIMEFSIPKSTDAVCSARVAAPYVCEIPVTPFGMSDSIPAPGKDFRLVYAEQGNKRDFPGVKDLGDCVVLVNSLSLDTYKMLCELHAGAIFVITGKYYQSAEEAGIYARNLRPKFLENGNIPTFAILASDAASLIRDGAETIHIELQQNNGEATSRNVTAEIRGTALPEEVVILTAHYDSVPIGTGSWDNATGSAALLGIYEHFLKNPAKRTMRFLWCGSEEQGLLGSKAYVEQHEDAIKDIRFCFNFDMCGTTLGSNLIFVTGGKELETYVDQYCRETGYAAKINVCVHSSDSAPFADKGVPAIGLSRGTSTSEIHTSRDLLCAVGEAAIAKNVADFIAMVDRVVNGVLLPVDTGMPDNMKQDLDRYFQRETKK